MSPFTPAEDMALRRLLLADRGAAVIASALQRPACDIKRLARELKIEIEKRDFALQRAGRAQL